MSKVAARIEKVTAESATGREAHNRRTKNCQKADKSLSHLNTYEGVNGVTKHVNALEKQLNKNLKAQGKRAIRKDAVKLIEIVVSSDLDFFEKNDAMQYFRDADEFFDQFWGEGNTIQKSVHMDEKTPHAHYFVTPIRDGKFNYSSFINGRDDLSKFQSEMYSFMVAKGYDFEERDLAKVTGKEHEKTRDWSKRVQKVEDMVNLMDEQKRADYAVKGVLAEQDKESLYNRLEHLTEANMELQSDNINLELENMELDTKYKNLYTGVLDIVKDKKNVKKIENDGRKLNAELEHKRIAIEQEQEKQQEKQKDVDMELEM